MKNNWTFLAICISCLYNPDPDYFANVVFACFVGWLISVFMKGFEDEPCD